MDSPLSLTIGARMSAFLSTAEDYNKHRKGLNRSLLKLRHELNLVTRDTKNYKSKLSTITAEDYNKNSAFGLLVLLTAERDHLHFLEIKSMLEISNEGVSSYKNLMISKLKKCCSNTKKLLEITANETDDLKLIEINLYDSLNEGTLAIQKRRWEKALHLFSISRCALDFLYNHPDCKFDKTFINELIETLVDPSLSLSISQLEIKSTDLKSMSKKFCQKSNSRLVNLIQKYDASFVSEISTSVELIDSITWRNHKANLYNNEIAYKIMELTKPDVVENKSLESFDKFISEWTSVLELHQADLNKNIDEDDQEKIQDRAILLTFINYNLLFTKIRRDLLLIEDLSKDFEQASKHKKLIINKDITRIYLATHKVVEEIKELPGVYNDSELSDSLENMNQYFTWKRLIRLSNSFLLNDKFLESLKVLYLINEQIQKIQVLFPVEDFPYSITSNEEFNQFKSEFNDIYLNNQILGQFSFESDKNPGFIIEKMNLFPINNRIVNLGKTVSLSPMLPKPVLFDVAFNYINYHGSDSKSSSVEPTETTSLSNTSDNSNDKKKSFFGIFGRN